MPRAKTRAAGDVETKQVDYRPPSPIDPLSSPFLRLRADSPFRPLDWRYQRAHFQIATDYYRTKNQDATVAKLIKHLQLEAVHPKRARKAWPALVQALAIRNDMSQTGRARQAELEGYLLAGESDEALSKRLNIAAEVVGVYESVFYSVRDRLSQNHVVGWELIEKAGGSVQEDDWESWTRLIGIIGGPYALDAYLAYRRHPPPTLPRSFEGMCDDELRELRDRLGIRHFLLCHFPEITPKNRQHWFNIDHFFELNERWFRPKTLNACGS